jgi:hypothetical protein
MLKWEIHKAKVCNGDMPLLNRTAATPIQTLTPKMSEKIATSVFSTRGILCIGIYSPFTIAKSQESNEPPRGYTTLRVGCTVVIFDDAIFHALGACT